MKTFMKTTTGALALMALPLMATTAMADGAGFNSMQPAVLANFVDETGGALIEDVVAMTELPVPDGPQTRMMDLATATDLGILLDETTTSGAVTSS